MTACALRGRLSLISGSNRKEQSRGHTKRPQPRKGIREPKAKPVGSNMSVFKWFGTI